MGDIIKTVKLGPPPSPDARVMDLIGQLNSLVDEYRIVYRGKVYSKFKKVSDYEP